MIKCSVWLCEEDDVYYAINIENEKCYAGFVKEEQAEEWIKNNGYELI